MALAQSSKPAIPAGGRSLALTRPIQTHKGLVSELVFQPLTAGTLMKMKRLPATARNHPDGSVTTEIDYELLGQYVQELTGIPLTMLELMAPGDMGNCMATIIAMVNEVGSPGK